MPQNIDVNLIDIFIFVIQFVGNSLLNFAKKGQKTANKLYVHFSIEILNNLYSHFGGDYFSEMFCCFSNEWMNRKKIGRTKKPNSRIYISETEPSVRKKFGMLALLVVLENACTSSEHTLFINCKELLNPHCCCFRWAALNFELFRNVLLCVYVCARVFSSVCYVQMGFFSSHSSLHQHILCL